jgi:hypothetical protein
MAKFAGLVGFVSQEETARSVWSQVETQRMMKGDVIRQSLNHQNDDKVNSDITLGHRVSLLGDAYATENYYKLKWLQYKGIKWEVTSVEMQRPRIIVSLGGVWNGYQA